MFFTSIFLSHSSHDKFAENVNTKNKFLVILQSCNEVSQLIACEGFQEIYSGNVAILNEGAQRCNAFVVFWAKSYAIIILNKVVNILVS